MPARFIVIQPQPASEASEVADELAAALDARGSLARVDALEGADTDAVLADSPAALEAVTRAIGAQQADAVLIDQLDAVPASTFDVLGWSLDVAAAVGARVVLVLEAEGVPADLLALDVEVARARARAHRTDIAAVALPAPVATRVAVEGVAVVPLPLQAEGVERLLATPAPDTTGAGAA